MAPFHPFLPRLAAGGLAACLCLAIAAPVGGQNAPRDDAELRAWFEHHRQRYDQPPRYDFREAVLAGERSRQAAEALARRLNAGQTDAADAAGVRRFEARPRDAVVGAYGEPFATALAAAPRGRWVALAQGSTWRVVRLEAFSPARPADFAAVAETARRDRAAEAEALRREATVGNHDLSVPEDTPSIATSVEAVACETLDYDWQSALYGCAVQARGAAPRRLRLVAHFSGGHDDTRASLVEPTLDGRPLACAPGSKPGLYGEFGDVKVDCGFVVEPGAGGQLRMTVRWSHAQFVGAELVAD